MIYLSVFDNWLWRRRASATPEWQKRGLRAARIVRVLIRDMMDGTLSLHAMSLVYTTLLSLVPLLAVSFSVLKAFDVQNQVEPILGQWLEPLGSQGQEITSKIIEFVSNMKVGVLGAVGVGLLFYTVLSLLQKIERAFNDAWRVKQDRSFAQRFTDYLSVLMIGPVLVFSALGLTGTLANSKAAQTLSELPGVSVLMDGAPRLVPYLLIIAAFSFMYSFVPNTKVKTSAALIGGVVAGALWQSTGWAFTAFLANSGSYAAVYSAFASVILFMIWMYLSWLILLIGASIAFYVQNPHYVRLHPAVLSNRGREEMGLAILYHVAEAFYAGRGGPSLEQLSSKLEQSSMELDEPLRELRKAEVLVVSQSNPPRYTPGQPFETLTVAEALTILRGRPVHAPAAVTDLLDSLDAATRERLGSLTVKDWVQTEAA